MVLPSQSQWIHGNSACALPQVLMEARMTGTLLPQHSRACQAVRRVGLRIAQVQMCV